MYISIFGALVTVVLLYIFIPSNGFIGAAWATLGAYDANIRVRNVGWFTMLPRVSQQ